MTPEERAVIDAVVAYYADPNQGTGQALDAAVEALKRARGDCTEVLDLGDGGPDLLFCPACNTLAMAAPPHVCQGLL